MPLARRPRRHNGSGTGTARQEPGTGRRMEALGRERALIYKTLVLTGLRKGELASITVGQLVLDADPAFLVLDAADEKNRKGSTIPLRADLAADLRQWLAERLRPTGGHPTIAGGWIRPERPESKELQPGRFCGAERHLVCCCLPYRRYQPIRRCSPCRLWSLDREPCTAGPREGRREDRQAR